MLKEGLMPLSNTLFNLGLNKMTEGSVSSGGKDAEQITTREKETCKPGDGECIVQNPMAHTAGVQWNRKPH